jgi:HlyD family secretion protein
MRLSPKIISSVLGAVVVLGAGYWWWQARHSVKLSFSTAAVKRGDVVASIGATGTLEPLEVVDVGAQVAGRISEFGKDKDGKTVDYGSVMAQGALLAKIDDSVYAADLSVAKAGKLSAQATLEQMKAKLDQAQADWQREQELFKSKLVSQSDFDTFKAGYEVAKANVAVANSGIAQAEADLEKAQRNLDYCTINCPVDGVIIDRRVNIGQTVVASLNAPSLFLIARDLAKMQIWASVNEADVGRIKPGTPVTFTVDAFPGRQFTGVVGKVRLNATMTQNVVLYTVEINVENTDKVLLPYLTASVRFQLNRATNALIVPNAALRWTPSSLTEVAPEAQKEVAADPPSEDKSRRTLWLKSGDFVRPMQVTAGVSDGATTAITADGLHEGDEIVVGEVFPTSVELKNPFLTKRNR